MALARKKSPARRLSSKETIAAYSAKEIALAQKLRDDPVFFSKHICGLNPHKKQIEVLELDVAQQFRILLPWFRQAGKSHCLSCVIAHYLFARPGFRAYCISSSQTQSAAIHNRICGFYENNPYLADNVPSRTRGDTLIVGKGSNESTCELVKVGLTGDLGRGRTSPGPGMALLCVDEFGAMQYGEQILNAMMPVVSVGGGLAILSSTTSTNTGFHRLVQAWPNLGEQYKLINCHWSETHANPEWIKEQEAYHLEMGSIDVFRREILGEFIEIGNQFFPEKDIQRCITQDIYPAPDDVYYWGLDPGGKARDSLFCVTIGKLNHTLQRIEIVCVRTFRFERHKYVQVSDDVQKVKEWDEITDVLLDLKREFNPFWCGVDPHTENSYSSRLKNEYQFPIHEVPISTNSQKTTFLSDLRRAIQEKKIVWSDPKITRDLQNFIVPTDETSGNYVFPKANYDIICTMAQIWRGYSERLVTPWAGLLGNPKPKGAVW